jgi:hypothetical protein
VEVGKACGKASGSNGWPMIAAHGGPWSPEWGKKGRRWNSGRALENWQWD